MRAFARSQSLKKKAFFFRGYTQALFFLLLILYVCFFSPYFFAGTWLNTVLDGAGLGFLIVGEFFRIWAVSHAGKSTRSRRLKAPVLFTTGPYAVVRNPIYLGNFLIGLGMVVFAGAMLFVPLFLIFFCIQYRAIVAQEESFLREKFAEEYHRYCCLVPKWFPRAKPITRSFGFGPIFFSKELGTAWGIVVGAFFFHWIDSPLHRLWITGVWYWLKDVTG